MQWIETRQQRPRDGVAVETKTHDAKGCRNEVTLKLRNGLWRYPDGSMYCYYVPMHWRYVDASHNRPHAQNIP